ncbi:MAG: terminase small subunit [Clostridia bacterium]|nr:terminase small subunit [Clostridia bacterium]
MTDAQKRFCDEYLIDLNATRAYKIAYPNCKKEETAAQAGSRLLRNVKVKEYIESEQKKIEERTQITQDMVVQELAKIGFFNIKEIYNTNGTLKSIKDMNDDVARAIASVKTLQKAGAMKIEVDPNGKDNVIPIEHIPEQTIEYKTNDKVKALELLGKHLGMFNDVNVNMKNTVVVELVDDVNE